MRLLLCVLLVGCATQPQRAPRQYLLGTGEVVECEDAVVDDCGVHLLRCGYNKLSLDCVPRETVRGYGHDEGY